jgi:hypothetical protein
MRCDHSRSCGAVSTGNAYQLGDDGDRDRRREFADQLRRAAPLEPVDQPVGEVRDARGEPFDLARQKGAVDQRAQPRVLRRLEFEQGVPLHRVKGLEMLRGLRPPQALAAHHMQDLPAEPAVAQQCGDLGVASEAPEAIVLPEKDRGRGADHVVSGVRIVEERGIAGVEPDAPLRGVDIQGHGEAHCRG